MIKLTVPNMCNGGLVERLHAELQKAIENILDPNTTAKKARTVTLKITIKPNEHRNMAEIMVATSSSLCPPAPIETGLYIGKDPRTGEVDAQEMAPSENPEQTILPGTMTKGKITTFNPNLVDRKSAAAGE